MHIRFYALQVPRMIPTRPQEGFKRPQEEPKGDPQGPKRDPRRPQDDPKTAIRRLRNAQLASQGLLDAAKASHDRNGCSNKPPREPQDRPGPPPKDPHKEPKRASKEPVEVLT